jgi:hypothetical protein
MKGLQFPPILFWSATTILLAGCAARSTPTQAVEASSPTATPSIDTQPFLNMASSASCADIQNRLYIIDDRYVFWASQGNCDDGGYAYILFGVTPQEKLCSLADSFVGPQRSCQSELDSFFQTILDNLDQPDLGLGDARRVHLVDLLTR